MLGAAAGGLSGLFGNRQQTVKSSWDRTDTSNTSSNARRRRVLRPEQENLLGPYMQRAFQMVQNPGQGLQPLKQRTMADVNDQFGNVEDAVRTKFALSGGGRSGKLGRAGLSAELARRGALGRVQSDFAGRELDQQQAGMRAIMDLLGVNFGEDMDETGTQTQRSVGSGTNIQPGNMAGGALGGALQGGLSLYTLQKLLKQ